LKRRYYLTKKDIENLTCFFYSEPDGLLAAAFSNLPLCLKHHCVQVGAVSGLMAQCAPERAVPEGMSLSDYANAVRYGGLYHDIGAYLVYNQRGMYPSTGERFLREQLDERSLSPAVRQVILETVQFMGERYDGQGYPDGLSGQAIPFHASLCAIADSVDDMISVRRSVFKNTMTQAQTFVAQNRAQKFSPDAVDCFTTAYPGIARLYKHWKNAPPIWLNRDIKPLARPIERNIF